MIIKSASTLSAIVSQASEIADSWLASPDGPQELWYRGHGLSNYQLVPSLYREDNMGFADVESSVVYRFTSLAHPLTQHEFSDWEWYFLARHHSIPTRLLDWTESLIVAVRFALADYCATLGDRNTLDQERRKKPKASIFDEISPCVWVLEAGTLNHFTMGEDATLIPGDETTNVYLPDRLKPQRKRSRFPIAIAPLRSNPRLAAQRGAFTLHGSDRRPLEHLLGKRSGPKQASERGKHRQEVLLAKIILDRSRLAHLVHELEIAGVDRFGLFPDLDHVGEQAKWEYKQSGA